jgi:hypothetical protein
MQRNTSNQAQRGIKRWKKREEETASADAFFPMTDMREMRDDEAKHHHRPIIMIIAYPFANAVIVHLHELH